MNTSIFERLNAEDTHIITPLSSPLIGGWEADFFYNESEGVAYVCVWRNQEDTLVAIVPTEYLDEVYALEDEYNPYNNAAYATSKLILAHEAMQRAIMWQEEGGKTVSGGRCYYTDSLCESNECDCMAHW